MDTNGHTILCEDYCSFEVAKLLKEKEFDWECEHVIWEGADDNYENYDKAIPNPTHQMAMKWLREEKNIIIVIQPEYFNAESKCSAWGCDIWADDNYEKLQGDFPSYEETVEAGIKYALENLI